MRRQIPGHVQRGRAGGQEGRMLSTCVACRSSNWMRRGWGITGTRLARGGSTNWRHVTLAPLPRSATPTFTCCMVGSHACVAPKKSNVNVKVRTRAARLLTLPCASLRPHTQLRLEAAGSLITPPRHARCAVEARLGRVSPLSLHVPPHGIKHGAVRMTRPSGDVYDGCRVYTHR